MFVDATMIARGGGLTVLKKYLEIWGRSAREHRFTVFVSRSEVREALQGCGGNVSIRRFGSEKSSGITYLSRKVLLGAIARKSGADIVYTTNSLVPFCRIPQVVHHRNTLILGSSVVRLMSMAGNLSGVKWALRARAARRSLTGARTCVFVSNRLKRMAEELVGASDSFVVIHNGMDARLCDVALRSGKPTDPARVGSCSRVIVCITSDSPHKNNSHVIRVLEHLISNHLVYDWRLKMIGAGSFLEEKRLIERLGVRDAVEWAGFLNERELRESLAGAHCLISTTFTESFGNTPLEAMSSGVPVVVSRVDAVPEICGDAALYASPTSVDEFATHIRKLADDKSLRKLQIERGFANLLRFSWEESASALLSEILKAGSEDHPEFGREGPA